MKNYKYILFTLSVILFVACNKIPQNGIIKNISNGITTTYQNIIPEETIKVMNEEVIEHNQIPLGYDFQVINKKVKGLTVVDDKVSIGCEMMIKDKNGAALLHLKDMFEENGVYHKDSITFLRSTVSTGSPMEYDQKYDIEIRYWDKFGEGELVNQFEIEIIDLP